MLPLVNLVLTVRPSQAPLPSSWDFYTASKFGGMVQLL